MSTCNFVTMLPQRPDPLAPMREARARRAPLPPLELHAELLLSAAAAVVVVGGFFIIALAAQALMP